MMGNKAKPVQPPSDMDEHNEALGEAQEEDQVEEVTPKTLTTKQVASELGTDPRTLRKFLRSDRSGIQSVGQGRRYEISERSVPSLKQKFEAWATPSQSKVEAEPDEEQGDEPILEKADIEEPEVDLSTYCIECDREFSSESHLQQHLDRAEVHQDD